MTVRRRGLDAVEIRVAPRDEIGVDVRRHGSPRSQRRARGTAGAFRTRIRSRGSPASVAGGEPWVSHAVSTVFRSRIPVQRKSSMSGSATSMRSSRGGKSGTSVSSTGSVQRPDGVRPLVDLLTRRGCSGASGPRRSPGTSSPAARPSRAGRSRHAAARRSSGLGARARREVSRRRRAGVPPRRARRSRASMTHAIRTSLPGGLQRGLDPLGAPGDGADRRRERATGASGSSAERPPSGFRRSCRGAP